MKWKSSSETPALHKNTHKSNKHLQHLKWHLSTSNSCPAHCSAHKTEQKNAEHKANKCQPASLGGCACHGRGCFALVPLNSLTDLFLGCNSCPQVVPARGKRVWHKARTLCCVASCPNKYFSKKPKCWLCSTPSFSAARGRKSNWQIAAHNGKLKKKIKYVGKLVVIDDIF